MKAVSMQNITKRFGEVVANEAIDLEVEKGEIHCILGENGAGKSTLMKILFGLFHRDQGQIAINEQPVEINSPGQAIELGLGMIHQHFMLVDRLSVAENIIAGSEPGQGMFIDNEKALAEVRELAGDYGFKINPETRIENLSVGEQQRVEILKALYREAEILILDEPTAVLTPQEVEELFRVMNNLRQDGKTIIFITHKLKETRAISDRVTILRNGRRVDTVNTADTDSPQLARMMVGREVSFTVDKGDSRPGDNVLEMSGGQSYNPDTHLRLQDLNFRVREGEIVGIAGVEGNGQLELEEVLMGLRDLDHGQLEFRGQRINELTTRERRQLGIAHIPSDRLKRGLIQSFTVGQNAVLGSEWDRPFAGRGILNRQAIEDHSQGIIEQFDVRTAGTWLPAGDLSGGNQQKLIVGRELSRDPELLLVAQPTRGIDVGAREYIHKLLVDMRDQGRAVLLISSELDELNTLSDRLLVIYEGRLVARGKTGDFTREKLGLLMAGQVEGESDHE